MSWWLFLPLAYLAMGLNLVCAGELAWREAAPDFLLLLWSVLTVRPPSARGLLQACSLGLLADLSTGGSLGVTGAIFATVTFLVGRVPREEGSRPLSWLLWSFPLMLVSLGAIHISAGMLQSSIVSLQQIFRPSLLITVATFGWGVGLRLLHWIMIRLFRFPREPAPRELQASSFFLSR